MHVLLRRLFLFGLYLTSPQVFAGLPGALVEADWLINNQGTVVVVDVQEKSQFQRHHLEGAVNLPFSQWRTGLDGKPPKSLPPLQKLSDKLGQSGISNTTALVIMSTGTSPGDMSAVARVFWTMKILGHDEVAILNGGLASYVNEHRGQFVRGPARDREPVIYKANPNMDLVATASWIQSSDAPRLDARTLAEKVGLVTAVGERPGTLPDAKHLPYDWLVENGSRLRSQQQLKDLFAYAGLSSNGAIHFCHTGNRASLTWFVDYALFGNEEARLYDGSMIEWGKDPSLPMQQDLTLGRPG